MFDSLKTRSSFIAPFRACIARLFRLLISAAFLLSSALLWPYPAQAQEVANGFRPVQELITSRPPTTSESFANVPFANPCDGGTLPSCDGNTTNLTFGAAVDGNIVLDAVLVGGERFEPAIDLLPPFGLAERLEFRRRVGPLPDGSTLPNRELLFFHHGNVNVDANPATNQIDLFPSLAGSIEEAMLSPIINRGIDNVFNNQAGGGQDTGNNIQRVDYLITGPGPGFPGLDITTLDRSDVGFLILERGGNDNFRIAAITAIDGNGDPANYGPLVAVPGTAAAWGNSNSVQIPTAVHRRDEGVNDPPLFRPSHLVGQQPVRGVFFPIDSLVEAATDIIYGYSLFANDVTLAGPALADINNLPTDTSGANAVGGLDLVAGGFGLIRQATSAFSLNKRITNLAGPANVPDFTVVEGAGDPHVDLLQQEGLGQGVTTITDPPVSSGNEVEYTIYFSNIGAGPAEDVVICDQIPLPLTFVPNAFGAGEGIQAIESSSPAGPRVTYTNADDGDPGRFFQPGETLPGACRDPDWPNGAVVVEIGDVDSNEVGLVTFRATVN